MGGFADEADQAAARREQTIVFRMLTMYGQVHLQSIDRQPWLCLFTGSQSILFPNIYKSLQQLFDKVLQLGPGFFVAFPLRHCRHGRKFPRIRINQRLVSQYGTRLFRRWATTLITAKPVAPVGIRVLAAR